VPLAVTSDDVFYEGFPIGTANKCISKVIPARALRISYVGELGSILMFYPPSGFASH